MRNVLKTQFNKKVGALLTCVAWLCFAAPVPAAPGDVDPLNANVVGSYVVATAVQPDGKTIRAGNVTSMLGQPRNNIARLSADGTLDAGFNPNANGQILGVAVPTVTLSTANLRTTATTLTITGTSFSTTPGDNTVVFTPAGTGVVTASTATSLTVTSLAGLTLGALNAVVTTSGLSSGAAVQVATVALTLPGEVDPLNLEIFGPGVQDSYINATVVQPDGKTILAGYFVYMLGLGRLSIDRTNADGTTDTGFMQFYNTGVAGDGSSRGDVNSVALQADGKILLGGEFVGVLNVYRNNIARLNANGRLDTGFNPNADGRVHSVAVQADGKILIGGEFFTVGGIDRLGLARLNANGTLDTGFNANLNYFVRSVAVQADGRILLGGEFTTVGGTERSFIARVDATGALDAGFNPNANNNVHSVAVQADGKILLGGEFSHVGGHARSYFARVDAAGAVDVGFNPSARGAVNSMVVQTDGKILIGGQVLHTVGGTERRGIARVDANGTLEAGFNPDVYGRVHSVAVQADGRILLGGEFTAVGGTPRNSFARLLNDPATQTLSVPDATQVTWTRGGSSPEVSQVTFEQSTDSGATWTALGSGTRIGTTPNWQLTGLSLPATGQLRARGRTSGGYQNGSSGVVEALTSFTNHPEIAVSGNAVNIADGDASPALADHTDFGSVNVAGSTLVRTYTITNSGTADLTLGTVTVGGTHAADFTVSLQPVSPVAPSASTSFQVTFDPSGLGPRSATLSFSNNDADEDPFNFAIQGTGTVVPDAPLILSAMPLDQAARISFNAPISDGGSAILDYSASCTPGPISNTQNALVIDVGGLTNNVAYRCSVRARNAIGMSAPSGELSVIPGNSQTITFDTAPTVTVGATGTVSATGGASGNAVTFTSTTTGTCTVSGTNGSIVTGVAVGTCTIAANQAGNASYNAAPQATQNITIGQGAQSITYGTNPGPLIYVPAGTFTVSAAGGASGNPVIFTSSTSAMCTTGGSNGATVTIVTAGTCTIAANQVGNASYNAAPQATQSITINRANQATLTATATATSLSLGQTATLGSTGGSGTGALSFSSNNANCTVSGTTLTAAAAGGCTITATKAADTNYNAASSAGLVILGERIFSNGFE